MKEYYKDYLEKDHSFDKVMLLGILALVVVLSGMFGFLYEYIFYYFNGGMKEFYWRGSNFLPWINVYATGAIMIYFLTYKYRKKPLKVFLISVISTGILEYISGAYLYITGNGLRCWDYNQEILSFGSIHGFVCLRSVLVFGLFGLMLIYLVLPILFKLAKKMNRKLFLIVSFTLFSIVMIDELYNLIFARLLHTPRASKIYKSLGFKYVKFK